MDDLISRLAALNLAKDICVPTEDGSIYRHRCIDPDEIKELPSTQTEPHYCRECKWSRCYIDVDKYGKSEIYWRCLIWVAETDEEGYCHEWKRRTE